MTAVGDIVALVLGRKKPRVSPTGSKATRTTAMQVRSGASDATEAAIEAIRTAKHTRERALDTAEAMGSSATASATRTARAGKAGATNMARAVKLTRRQRERATALVCQNLEEPGDWIYCKRISD